MIEIGDKVEIKVLRENREYGFNPAPDGTKAEVVGFEETYKWRIHNFGKKPGVYHNRCWPIIKLPNGEEISINSSHLTLLVSEEEKQARREAAKTEDRRTRDYLRPLPETPFWEGDFVNCPKAEHLLDEDEKHFVVVYINPNGVNDGRTFYTISDSLNAGWSTHVAENELTLVARGKVWQYFHNEPIQFEGLREEADFFRLLGRIKEVRNPNCNLYVWTKDEILDAMEQGTVHGFYHSSGMFGIAEGRLTAINFLDEELGERVRLETLKGFGRIR